MSRSSQQSNPTTINTDQRVAVQGGAGVSGDGNSVVVNAADADAVKAVAQMGGDVLENVGGAIVKLNQASVAANATAWDSTLKKGAALVDKLIDKSTQVGTAAVQAYKPAEAQGADVGKWAVVAAAVVAGAVLLSRGSR